MAKQRGLIEIDATCGLVTRVHSAVKRFAAMGLSFGILLFKDFISSSETQCTKCKGGHTLY